MRIRFIALFSGFLLLLAVFPCWSQEEPIEPRYLIECPTAGLLPRGSFDVDLCMFSEGGLLARITVGLMERMLIGFSFGGTGIIGDQEVYWNPRVEFVAKYRLLEEYRSLPALTLGFDSQGYGRYDGKLERYARTSKGFYLVLSKNYRFLGRSGLHLGTNYSLEKDGEGAFSGYIGLNKNVNEEISILGEYDFGLNEIDLSSFRFKDGYLNAGIRWMLVRKLSMEVDLKDLIGDHRSSKSLIRELRIVYFEYF